MTTERRFGSELVPACFRYHKSLPLYVVLIAVAEFHIPEVLYQASILEVSRYLIRYIVSDLRVW